MVPMAEKGDSKSSTGTRGEERHFKTVRTTIKALGRGVKQSVAGMVSLRGGEKRDKQQKGIGKRRIRGARSPGKGEKKVGSKTKRGRYLGRRRTP